MRPQWALPATLLFPIFPWIVLTPSWVAGNWSNINLYWLMGSGLILDLWWGKPLGLTPLILIILATLIKFGGSHWPADPRIFWVVSIVVSLVIFEGYLFVL